MKAQLALNQLPYPVLSISIRWMAKGRTKYAWRRLNSKSDAHYAATHFRPTLGR